MMNFRSIKTLIIAISIFLITPMLLTAQSITNMQYASGVPASISVQPDGADDVLMAGVRYDPSSSISFSAIGIELLSSNAGLIETLISDVNVYADDGDQLFEPAQDTLLNLNATDQFTDTVFTLNINLDPTAFSSGSSWGWLWVAFDLPSTIDIATTVGCEIKTLTFGAPNVGTGGTGSPYDVTADVGLHGVTGNLDDYRITDTYTDRAPATAYQTDEDIPIMNIDLDLTNTSETSASADIDSITITRIGTNVIDADVSNIKLFNDNGTTAGEVDASDTLLDTKTVSGGTAIFNPVTNINFDGTGISLLVSMTLAADAAAGTTIGFSVNTPGNADPDLNGDIVFNDIIDDTLNTGSPAYIQKGIIQNTTTQNSSLVEILEYVEPDITPPVLDTSTPSNGATGVLRSSTVQVNFSEAVTGVDGINVFTVSTGNYNSLGGTPISGTVTPATADPGIGWVFTPSVNLDFETTYYVELTTAVEDTSANAMTANAQFSFTTELATPPSLDSSTPSSGATGVLRSSTVQVNFDEPVTGVDGADVFTVCTGNYNSLGGTQVTGTVSFATADPGAGWIFTPSANLDFETTYYVELTTAVVDVDATPMTANAQFSFTTELATPPSLDSSTPSNGATGVLRSSTVQVNFDEPVTGVDGADVFTVSTGGYKSGTGIPIAGTVTPVTADPGAGWIFTPSANLDFETTYYVELTTGVVDVDSTPITSDVQFSFTTEAATPPSVLSTYPGDNSNNISISSEDTVISVTFSEDVTGVDASSFTLTDEDGAAVSGTVSGSGLTYILTLDEDLAYNTTYTGSVSTSVADADGTNMAAAYSWEFTTEVEYPDFSEPIVINNTISPGSTGPTLIFVPEPPAGPDTPMTVNVFTPTGKRVISLVDNVPHSEISSPIEWTGINGLGKQLGPGIYFVEIRAEGYRKTLKIRIIR